MDKKEQEMLERIREMAGQIEIPETLDPEGIQKKLESEKAAGEIRRYRKRLCVAGSIAAACVVFAAGILFWNRGDGSGTDTQQRMSWMEDRLADTGGKMQTASDYQKIYEYVEKSAEAIASSGTEESASSGMAARNMTASADSSSTAETGSVQDVGGVEYSQTNVRQEGVDEGDVVKTDGRYLYVLQDDGRTVAVVDTCGDQMKKVGAIELEKGEYIYEIYLAEGKLVLVAECSEDSGFRTEAVTYDIQDPSHPREAGRVAQSGSYQSSRVSDGYLYLFSSYYVDLLSGPEPRNLDSYLPEINDKVMKETDIYLPQTEKADMYEVVSSVNLDSPDQISDSKALLSKGGELYVSNQNIYYYETLWQSSGAETTAIRRLSYDSGVLKGEAQGSFEGYLNDSFSIDEYHGFLRLVTTVDDTNSVYVLDQDLEKVGAIEGLAEEERIYSARFMGDTAYFVTFKETDPLFSVDLSDPEKPTILGTLKIPGFSEYLHVYGEGKLLGIGMDVEEGTQITDGVKLTMFDISDPRNVTEENTLVLEHVYHTDLFYDYKAVLIDPQTGLIGFSGYGEGGQMYFVFGYDEANGFDCRMEEEINGSGSRSARGVYIGESLYVVQGNVIEVYSLENYQKTGDIIL
nr:beta-propeller domain-containing protein [uncultured Merdimonas sp.]